MSLLPFDFDSFLSGEQSLVGLGLGIVVDAQTFLVDGEALGCGCSGVFAGQFRHGLLEG